MRETMEKLPGTLAGIETFPTPEPAPAPSLKGEERRISAGAGSASVGGEAARVGQGAEGAGAVRRWPLGVGRPPLEVGNLPTPEEVFNFRRVGWEERLLLLMGPGVIALGVSIGSGEWVLGPRDVAQYGMQGIFWVILVSIILQVFYNVELARYTLATGESPIVGFGRAWPGAWLWLPVALICFYMAFILGSWTVSAGQSLYILILGRSLTAPDIIIARQVGLLLLASIFGLLMLGQRVERTMEVVQGLFIPYILIGLLMVTVVIVPGETWNQAARALLIPSRPPAGVDITRLGALAGFAALASGLNYMFIGYYRDRGYGMGYNTGSITGAFSHQPADLQPVGRTFAETPANTLLWKRWFRLLLWDQWGIYFIGCVMGIFLPAILGFYLVNSGAALPDALAAPSFLAVALGDRFGQLVFGWALIIGFVILFTTQIAVLELLARNLTEALYASSAPVRQALGHDARKLYYPAMFVLVVVIAIIVNLSDVIPANVSVLSGNLSNLAALIFPIITITLNRRLPRPARSSWWSIVVLAANVLFFGFFFINFMALQITGAPLVRF